MPRPTHDEMGYPLRFIAAVCAASLAAGPLVIFWADLLANHLAVTSNWGGAEVALHPAVIAFGFIVALMPTVIGSALMIVASDRTRLARNGAAWVLAGGLMVLPFVLAFGDPADPDSLAMIATGATCAGICRAVIRLD